MSRTDERTALCALNKALGYVPAAGHALLRHFGAAAPVFDQPDAFLREALGPYRDFAEQLDGKLLEWAAGELDRIASGGFRMIGFGEEDYPSLLTECEDPPLALYYNASSPPAAVFEMRPCIAVVGTRDLSPYGRDWCRRLVLAMGEASVPPCIVSGLAFGADGIAHRTALECGLTTIGVMATGIEKVYPWQHTELAGQMVRTPGCAVVTDYPTGSAPVALNFIRRNRMGGSLITAKYACDYNRDVYALPGRADDVRSAGCNSLIRQRMADIVTDPEDLVERLGLGKTARRRKAGLEALLGRKYGTDSPLIRLALTIKGHPGISLDEIVRETGWSWPEVQERAAILETDGFLETDLLRRCTIPAKIV